MMTISLCDKDRGGGRAGNTLLLPFGHSIGLYL
jgi:hypothetical protein